MATLRRDAETMVHRGSYVGLAVLMAVFAVGGFWRTYWGPLLGGTLDLHWLLHLHGVAFTLWLALLITQTALVFRGRSRMHQRLGTYVGVFWGLVIITVGLSAVFGRISPDIGREFESLSGFIQRLPVGGGDIFGFVVLFGSGLAYRNRPAVHKRLMIMATAVLLPAAAGRIAPMVPIPGVFLVAGAPLAFVALAMGCDWWAERRVHPTYLIGGAFVLLLEARFFFIFSEPWRDVSRRIAESLEAVLRPLM